MTYGIKSVKKNDLSGLLADIDDQIREADTKRLSLTVRVAQASDLVKEDIEQLYKIPRGSSDSIVPVIDISAVLNDKEVIGSISFEIEHMKVIVQLARTNTEYNPPYTAGMTILYKGIANQSKNLQVANIQELPDTFKQLFYDWCKDNRDTVREIRTRRI